MRKKLFSLKGLADISTLCALASACAIPYAETLYGLTGKCVFAAIISFDCMVKVLAWTRYHVPVSLVMNHENENK